MIFNENGPVFSKEEVFLENMKYGYYLDGKKKEFKIKNFDHLLQYINNPYDLIELLKYNNLKFPSNNSVLDYCLWPDQMIKLNKGICLDISNLVYLCCNYWRLKANISLISYYSLYDYEDTEIGHAVPVFQSSRNYKYYVASYLGEQLGGLYGPFESYQEAIDELGHVFLYLLNPVIIKNNKPYDPMLFEDPKALSKLSFVFSYCTNSDLNKIIRNFKENAKIRYCDLCYDAKLEIERRLKLLKHIHTQDGTIEKNKKDPYFSRIKEAKNNLLKQEKVQKLAKGSFINITHDKNQIAEFRKRIEKYEVKNPKELF